MYGPLWYRNLEEGKKLALKNSKGNVDANTAISDVTKEELKWWQENVIISFNLIDTSHGNPDLIFLSDASLTGLGCFSGTVSTGSEWK